MSTNIRLIYASTSTANSSNLHQDLVGIVNQSQTRNLKSQVCGVLFYSNNYFFHCLEGDKAEIDALYQKILKDPRHHKMKLLVYTKIQQPRFAGWSMKYVMHEPSIDEFFASNQVKEFNPYTLEKDLIDPFLNILFHHTESAPGIHEKFIEKGYRRRIPVSMGFPYRYVMFLLITALLIIGVYQTIDYSVMTIGHGVLK